MHIPDKLTENFSSFADRPAVSDLSRIITYREAGESSKRLARHLIGMNLRNRCIGIDISDRIDHVVAIMAVILSGNYYLSITSENRHYIVDLKILPVDYILSSEQLTFTSDRMDDTMYGDAGLQFCAFLTSGTTGEPKVVVHSTLTILEDTLRQIEENHITSKDKIDLAFSFAFSASLASIFPALLTGAELCIFDTGKFGIEKIPSFWEEKGITFTTLSVSSFRTLCVLFSSFRQLINLRFVSIGAEPQSEKDIHNFYEKFPAHTILQVAYATTETRTIAQFKTGQEFGHSPYPASVGLCVRNKMVKILSDEAEELPPYAIGEIVVESDYIASRYGNESSTEHTFVISDGSRISFFTGDLGYLNPEGYLFYTGRKHEELKINGMKVNLALIEQTIRNNFNVRQAAVVINSTIPGRHVIAAFVLPEESTVMDKISSQVAALLPFSHPAVLFIPLYDYPVTHSGKIDKKKLESYPLQDNAIRNSINFSSLPDEALVESIICIWSQLLNVRHIGFKSHYFDNLGGDSLTSLLCIKAMETEFQLSLPVNALSSYPTPEAMAHFISNFLGQDPVALIRHNTYIPGRKNMFIVGHYGTGKEFEILLNTKLSHVFNIAFLNYDLIGSSGYEGGAQRVLDRMKEIIAVEKETVIAGYSFNGYIAHQLAGVIPQVSCCILFDTPDYFNFEPYRHRILSKVAVSILKTTFLEKDFRFPWFVLGIIARSLKRKIRKSDPDPSALEESKIFIDAINNYILHLNQKSVPSNCLFVKATRAFGWNYDHGYSWQDHFSGVFKMLVIRGDHGDVLGSRYANKIVDFIIHANLGLGRFR